MTSEKLETIDAANRAELKALCDEGVHFANWKRCLSDPEYGRKASRQAELVGECALAARVRKPAVWHDRVPKRTPAEWAKLTGITILDPDGWRAPNEKSMDERIDEAEWQWRMSLSTCAGLKQETQHGN